MSSDRRSTLKLNRHNEIQMLHRSVLHHRTKVERANAHIRLLAWRAPAICCPVVCRDVSRFVYSLVKKATSGIVVRLVTRTSPYAVAQTPRRRSR